jgi:signal transduction histidine kinase/DNA-binding response OmpR family regulator
MEENLHILLIEDNSAEAFLLQESLAQVDHPPDVIHAERLDEALSSLKKEKIDAILLDLALPDSEGLATLERTNAEADFLPIIVLTGLEDEAVAIDAVRKGAQDYLIKGQTGARQLVQTIQRAIERKRLERALALSAQRNLLLAEISAKVMAQTDLDGLLTTVVEGARKLTSARFSCSGAGYENGKFRCRKYSQAEGIPDNASKEACQNEGSFLELVNQNESVRLSNKELRRHAKWWGLAEYPSILRGFMGARLVDVRGQTSGSIIVSDREGNEEFSEADETLLRQLALITSLALQHVEARTAAEAASVAKSQFLANMSHELRTPMNAILGMTDLALAEELPLMVRDYLQTARDSAGVLLEILNEILDLSRIEAGRFELESTAFSLHKAVEQVIKTLRVRAREKGLALIYNLPSHMPDLLIGDPLRFRQILMNLVDNAIKFTHIGKVVVKAEVREHSSEHVKLEFAVTDTGIGILPEDRERIFSPFTQADASTTRNYGGTGLGLTISRKFVELMNGQIWVESRPNQGSTFYFTVSLKMPQKAVAVEGEAGYSLRRSRRRQALQVLLAEDTPTNQKLAERLLSRRGHVVEIAGNGQQALEMVEQRDYDVVLMDVQMPVMDGIQATMAIRALPNPVKARLPIIAMTAHALKEDAERCLAAGMDAYVSKPIQAEEFIELVELLGESDSGAKIPPQEIAPDVKPAASAGKPLGTVLADKASIGIPASDFDLAEAVKKCFGKYEFFLDMANGFFSETDDSLHAMNEACKRGTVDDVRNVAHQLKNTVIYLGSQQTTEAIVNVEKAAKSGNLDALSEALNQLRHRLEGLKNSLSVYCKSEKAEEDRIQNAEVRGQESK